LLFYCDKIHIYLHNLEDFPLRIKLFSYILFPIISLCVFMIPIQTSAEIFPTLNVQMDKNAKEFYDDLNGDWLFFPEQFISPDKITESLNENNHKVVSIPDSFERHTGKINTFGTYTTTVKIPEKHVDETLAIHVPFQYSAYTL